MFSSDAYSPTRENDHFCETTYIRYLASSEMACIDRLVVLA